MEELTFVIDIKKSGDSCKKFDGVKKYIATADIIDDEIVGYTEVTYDNKPSRANVVAKPGDVLFAKMQNTIKVIVVDEETCNYIYSTGFYCISDERFLPKFLKCYFMSKTFNDKKDKNCNGATMKALSDEGFKKIKLPLIPKEIQQRIIDEYIALSASIKNKKNQINVFDELIKSQFIEMFGNPITNEKKYSVLKLKNISEKITNGNTPHGGDKNYVEKGIIFIRSQNVLRNKIDLSDVVYIDESTNNSIKDSMLKSGDILITKTGRINTENSSLGRPAIFEGEDYSANLNGHVYLIRLNDRFNKKFVLYTLLQDEYREYIRSVCVGGIDKRQINKNHVEDFPILVAPRPLQDQFAAIVEQIDKSKFINKMSLILQF